MKSGDSITDGMMNYIYDGEETSLLYESAVNMLHIVLLHSPPPTWSKENVTEREPFLACMRIKTDKLPLQEDEENGNGEGNGAGEDQQQGGGDNAAPYGAQANLLAAGCAFVLAMIMTVGL